MSVKKSDYAEKTTNALITIEYEHKEIHDGNHYFIAGFETVGLSAEIDFVLTTPDTQKWAHLTFLVQSTKGFSLEMYEGASSVVGGTPITPRNNNRNFSDSSIVEVIKDPTSITAGSKIAEWSAGSNIKAGFVERTKEIVLKQNIIYLFRITSLDATNLITWDANFYEHINKNLT